MQRKVSDENGSRIIIDNVFWKFAERILAQLVSFAVSIILARLLEPDDYGVVAMVNVFIALANVFISSGFPSALIQKKDADDVDFSSVFAFNMVFSFVLYVVLFLAAPAISRFYAMPILSPVIRAMSLQVVIASVKSVQQAYVSRNMMFRKFFWSTLYGTLLSAVMGVTMAYKGFGVWSLVVQYLTNAAIDTAVLWFTVDWRPRRLFSWSRLRGLVSFGWKILVEGLSETVTRQVRSLVIGKVYTSSDLGFYTTGDRMPGLVVDNIATSISAVLFPAMSKIQDNMGEVKEMMRKAVRVTSFVVFPMLTGLGVVAKPLVSVVLTDKWLGCVPYLRVFCFTQAATVGMIARHQALNATGRSDVFMIEHMFYRGAVLVILFCVYRISIMAIAWSVVAGSVIMTGTVMYTSKQFNGYGYREQIRDIVPMLGGCVVMGVPVYFVQKMGLNDGLTLAIQIILGVAVYTVYSVILGLPEFRFLREYICGFFRKKGE